MFLYYYVLYLSSLLGVMSQIQLIQPSSEIKKPGDSVKIPCQTSNYTFTNYFIHWVQQVPGKGLVWIGRIDPSDAETKYSSSFQGRFTISTDNSITTAYLQITSLSVGDTATYFCARILAEDFDVWGPGTTVTVSSAVPKAPTVFPLLPCCDLTSSQSEVTIGCLSTGYLPNQIDVQWNSGAITQGIKNFPAVLERSGLYLSSSQLTISASEWESKSKSFECNVIYKPTGAIITKKIQQECAKQIPPTVEVMQSSCGESGSVDLVCLITGYSPKDINIEWLINGQPTSISPSNSTPYKQNDGSYGSSSRVRVPKVDWSAGDTYTCKVKHPASNTKAEDKIQKCTDDIRSPKVVILPPSPKDLLISREPKLICLVSQLLSSDSLNIKWSRTDGKKIFEFRSPPELKDDGSFTAKSTLRITLTDWDAKKPFTCTVEHPDLASPIIKTIEKRDVKGVDPSVYVYPPTEEELKKKDFVSVNCMIKDFTPKEIYVQWLKNGVIQDEDYYINTEPILQDDDDTYLMFSKLTIEKSDWNRGATLTCKAVHNNIISSDIKKSKGK